MLFRSCYANYSQESVVKNCSQYNLESSLLCGIVGDSDKVTERKVNSLKQGQMNMFDL